MIDTAALQLLLVVLTGCLDCQEREALRYLIEENRLLRRLCFANIPPPSESPRRRALRGRGEDVLTCPYQKLHRHRRSLR